MPSRTASRVIHVMRSLLALSLVTACTGVYRDPDSALDHREVKQVFATRATYAGSSLGGLAGADAICQTTAAGAHLTGTFKAWLSDVSAAPVTRFTHARIPYALLDGTRIADDWPDLIHADLDHPIDLDEHGEAIPSVHGDFMGDWAWTGTGFTGARAPYDNPDQATCVSWTVTQAGGGIGDRGTTDKGWTDSGGISCGLLASLYCFEQ